MKRLNDLKGKRYINLVRCSTDRQSDTSIPDQLKLLDAFAEQHGMAHVDDVSLDGVTGSIPGARSDVEQLIRRKRERDDFDVLLVQDTSRLTRGGAEHGMKIQYDLKAAGIRLVFTSSDMPEGKYGSIFQSFSYFTAQQHAQAISFASARGSQSAIESGRVAHCARAAYGIDRLYLSAGGEQLHVIRTLPNGTQQRLDPKTHEVLATFGRNEGKRRSCHYIKQKDERVELIPGAEDQVSAVRQMFRRHLIDGWGYFRIASELNQQGIVSPMGKQWNTSAVQAILKNPIYTGMSVANRYSMAVYHRRSANAPAPAEVDEKELASRKRPAERIRPRTDWIERDEPRLADFLGLELRRLACEMQAHHLANQAGGRKAGVNRDRHRNRAFILKGILTAKQSGLPMSGRTTGSGKYKTRYYAVTRAFNAPNGDRLLGRFIPAEPLERTVIDLLGQVLMQAPEMRSIIEAELRHRRAETMKDAEDLKQLAGRRDELGQMMGFVIGNLGQLGKELAAEKVRQIEAEAALLDQRIAKATAAAPHSAAIERQVETVIESMGRIEQSLDQLAPEPLRRLLQLLVPKLQVDLETRAVEIEIALPSWAAIDESAMAQALCLDGKSPWRSANEAQRADALRLAEFRCDSASRPLCFSCRRMPLAA